MPSENFWQTFVFLVEENFKIFKIKTHKICYIMEFIGVKMFFYCKLVATFQKGLIKFASFLEVHNYFTCESLSYS